jgi:hypothetical protein
VSSAIRITLTLDFSNGVTKTFTNLTIEAEVPTLGGLLSAAGERAPGLQVDEASDRAGRAMLRSIDGIAGPWSMFVGARDVTTDRLPTATSVSLGGSNPIPLADGDVVVFKVVEPKPEPEPEPEG